MNKAFIPDVNVSGAATHLSFFVYRNAVIETLIRLGAKWPEGMEAWARMRHAGILARYNLGIRPEDAAQDLFNDHFRNAPKMQHDGDRGMLSKAVVDAKRRGRWNVPLGE